MNARILLRTPGRPDVVLTLTPGHYERATLAERAWPAPHVSVLLLDVDGVPVHDPAMHIDPQTPPRADQLDMFGGAR